MKQTIQNLITLRDELTSANKSSSESYKILYELRIETQKLYSQIEAIESYILSRETIADELIP